MNFQIFRAKEPEQVWVTDVLVMNKYPDGAVAIIDTHNGAGYELTEAELHALVLAVLGNPPLRETPLPVAYIARRVRNVR